MVLGASGLVGKSCVYQLIESGYYSRIVLPVRKELPIKHHLIHQVITDFEHLDKVADELFADDVYCCLGTTIKTAGSQDAFRKVDHDYPLAIAKLTVDRGASHFLLVSAMGANKDAAIFYNRVKGEVEHAIQQLPFQSISIFRPSLLLGNRTERRVGESIAKVLMRATSWIMVGPLKAYKAIQAITVAKGMLKAAQQQKVGCSIYLNHEIEILVKQP